MDEISEKKKIAAAMQEPKAPPGLVENMVQRAIAMERGRSALQQLKEAGPELPAEKRTALASSAVVGRIAAGKWPDNASAEDLTKQLAENPVFRKASDLPAGVLAEKISDGSFLKSFRKVSVQKRESAAKVPSRKDPENGAPVI